MAWALMVEALATRPRRQTLSCILGLRLSCRELVVICVCGCVEAYPNLWMMRCQMRIVLDDSSIDFLVVVNGWRFKAVFLYG